jgi:hypothetical protein
LFCLIIVDNNNTDLVLHECNPSVSFDDENLPDGISRKVESCSINIATVCDDVFFSK